MRKLIAVLLISATLGAGQLAWAGPAGSSNSEWSVSDWTARFRQVLASKEAHATTVNTLTLLNRAGLTGEFGAEFKKLSQESFNPSLTATTNLEEMRKQAVVNLHSVLTWVSSNPENPQLRNLAIPLTELARQLLALFEEKGLKVALQKNGRADAYSFLAPALYSFGVLGFGDWIDAFVSKVSEGIGKVLVGGGKVLAGAALVVAGVLVAAGTGALTALIIGGGGAACAAITIGAFPEGLLLAAECTAILAIGAATFFVAGVGSAAVLMFLGVDLIISGSPDLLSGLDDFSAALFIAAAGLQSDVDSLMDQLPHCSIQQFGNMYQIACNPPPPCLGPPTPGCEGSVPASIHLRGTTPAATITLNTYLSTVGGVTVDPHAQVQPGWHDPSKTGFVVNAHEDPDYCVEDRPILNGVDVHVDAAVTDPPKASLQVGEVDPSALATCL